MSTFKRILSGAMLLTAASGFAGATTINSVSAPVSFQTDNTYSLTLSDFNCPAGLVCTLTGATIYFSASEAVSNLNLANTAPTAQTFDVDASSNVLKNFANTASAADVYTGEVLDLFDTGIGIGGVGSDTAVHPSPQASITLGSNATFPSPSGVITCPAGTPSTSCNSVTYSTFTVANTDPNFGFTTGTGMGGLLGVIKSITGADLANYVGSGTFNLNGGTKSSITISGGGNNIQANVNTAATMQAEIDYTYTSVPSTGTPEPTTMLLFSSALLGLGFIGRKKISR